MALAGCASPAPGAVTGTVTTSSGDPCAHCAIGLTALTPGLAVIEMARYTDAEGTFRVERLQPGEYRVAVFHSGSSADEEAVVEPGLTTAVDLEVP